MTEDEIKQCIKEYIRNNMYIAIETKSNGSECTYNEYTFVNLYLDGEIISSSEIDGLTKNY